eukprot:TRINITY_DN1061_c0_g1_i1.p1 TRINITY_DN1061_c0_g1~~TRINITY_DN1061_c0_g1_i1.p1  ORF type:complete len:301 (-),score=71.34 TRINITY_DN1061_c0_g1_i1:202-1104(-)
MFEQNELLYNFSEEFEDLTPKSMHTMNTIGDNFETFMQLGFSEEDSEINSIPSSPKTPSSPMVTKEIKNNGYNTYQYSNSQRNTNLHNSSYAPIYYPQQKENLNLKQENFNSNNNEFIQPNSYLPFWTAAPLPFVPEKFPPTEIIPSTQSLTEKDHKRLHRQEAIKKWMNKRNRRDFNRKVAPQKSQAANNRQRIGGKFISTDDETKEMEKEILRLKKQVEEEEIIAHSLEIKLNQTHMELSLLRSHGLVNGMLKSQLYLPTLEPNKQQLINNDPSKDPRQSTIDYNKVRTKLKKTGVNI